MSWTDYVIKHEYGGVVPTCACGCGTQLEWKKGGYPKYTKGHDNRGLHNARANVSITQGWCVNPFTSLEEFNETHDDVAFLKHCVNVNDAVTKEHDIKIGWYTTDKQMRVFKPEFKHITKSIIYTFDDFSDVNGSNRLNAVKSWCDVKNTVLLILKRVIDDKFDVIGYHKRGADYNEKAKG
jgi:hypothetical protein